MNTTCHECEKLRQRIAVLEARLKLYEDAKRRQAGLAKAIFKLDSEHSEHIKRAYKDC